MLLAAFFLWFFRDPDRAIPDAPGALVSPGDGTVTDVSQTMVQGSPRLRISIFLNVFNVHVNRSPISGVIRDVRYQKGEYLNAMNAASAEHNEQNQGKFHRACTLQPPDRKHNASSQHGRTR